MYIRTPVAPFFQVMGVCHMPYRVHETSSMGISANGGIAPAGKSGGSECLEYLSESMTMRKNFTRTALAYKISI